MGDQRGTLLLQQLDQPLLLLHQRIDLRRLLIEEVGDGLLFVLARNCNSERPELPGTDSRVAHTNGLGDDAINEVRSTKHVGRKP